MSKYTTTNPTTGQIEREFPTLQDGEVEGILARSHAAYDGWRSTSPQDRAKVLADVAQAYRDRAEELGRLISTEMGKPLPQAIGEAKLAGFFVGKVMAATNKQANGKDFQIVLPLVSDLMAKGAGEAIKGVYGTANWDWQLGDDASKALRRDIYGLLKMAVYDYERIQYNTVVSTCMKMLNTLESAELDDTPEAHHALAESTSILLRVLYPVVPHVTWQIWQDLGLAEVYGDLLDAPWPDVDEAALIADEIELVLQINGKLRGAIKVPHGATKMQIEQTAVDHDATGRFLEGRPPKRVIVVPGKLVNIVG